MVAKDVISAMRATVLVIGGYGMQTQFLAKSVWGIQCREIESRVLWGRQMTRGRVSLLTRLLPDQEIRRLCTAGDVPHTCHACNKKDMYIYICIERNE